MGDKAKVAAVLEDYTTAPISEAERALFALIAKVIDDSTSITAEDLERARGAGWTDEALYDAITVCALFQFYNTWIDATGVSDMPAAGYEMSGKRLAEMGYAYAEEADPARETVPSRVDRDVGIAAADDLKLG